MDAIHSERSFFEKHFSQGEAVTCLEIGPGTAVASITLHNTLRAANIPCHFLMIDVNPDAARTARQTCMVNKMSSFDVLRGDLVTCLKLNQSVDVLVFNPPYVPTPPEEVGGDSISAAWAGGDKGREVLDRLLLQLNNLLSLRGVFYVVAVEENDVPELTSRLAGTGFQCNLLVKKRERNELLMVLKITRVTDDMETKTVVDTTTDTTTTTNNTTAPPSPSPSPTPPIPTTTTTSSTPLPLLLHTSFLQLPPPDVLEHALSTEGFLVIDHAFSLELAAQCRCEIDTMELKPGTISKGGANEKSTSRSDVIAFLNNNDARPPSLGELAAALEMVRVSMSSAVFDTDHSSVMVAKYVAGEDTGYVRHRDSQDQNGGRRVTSLCYFGDENVTGGHLKIYSEEMEEEEKEKEKGEGYIIADIEPKPGRIVLFKSYLQHEVMPVEAGCRYALTSWFTNKAALAKEILAEERLKALRKLAFSRLRRNLSR